MQKTKSIWVFIGFWILTLGIYYRTMNAGFTMDFPGWQERYDAGSFKDILNCFGYKGLHQILHLTFYSFYRIFGTEGPPWYLLFTFLHALNGTLVFVLFRFLFSRLSQKNSAAMAMVAALFFLVSPYNVETVVWKVCVHYLMSMLFLLVILIQVSRYWVKPKRKRLIYIWVTYVLALFSLELAMIFPLLILIYALFGYFTYASSTSVKKNHLGRLTIPPFLLLTGYLLLNKLILGDWVGHYGARTHLRANFSEILATLYKYFTKFTIFGRFHDFKMEERIYQIFDTPVVTWGITFALVISGLIIIGRWRDLPNQMKLGWLFFVSFFVALLPVANLFFYFLQYSENDRYNYLASPFYMGFLVLILFQFRYTIRYLLVIGWLALSLVLQQKIAIAWEENAIIYESLLHDFRWYDRPKILLLSSPGNYQGTFLFRIIQRDDPVVDDLKYHLRKPYNGQLQSVAQINMMHLDDGVHVEQTDSLHLKVIFNQWGTWWWRSGIGAVPYETDLYKFELINKGYLLTFKRRPKDYTLIYQDGHRWREFEFR